MTFAVWVLRILVGLQALQAIGQPVLAGSFMSGNYDALTMHSMSGSIMSATAMLVGLGCLIYIACGGRPWPLLTQIVFFFVISLQVGMGHSRNLAIHVPLGVAVVGLTLAFAIWTWLPRAKQRRTYLIPKRATPEPAAEVPA